MENKEEKKTECLIIDFLKGFCNDCLAKERDERCSIIKTIKTLTALINVLVREEKKTEEVKLKRNVCGKVICPQCSQVMIFEPGVSEDGIPDVYICIDCGIEIRD